MRAAKESVGVGKEKEELEEGGRGWIVPEGGKGVRRLLRGREELRM